MFSNKKGKFLDNILGAIIAVLILAGIIYLSISLYGVTVGQEEKKAQDFLDSLVGKIENLEDGETGVFPMLGVSERYLVGWSKDEINRPEKCYFDSCLCVCPEVENPKDFRGSCQEKGFCREIDYDNLDLGSSIGLISGGYNYVDLNNNFREFRKDRTQSLLDISETNLVEITVHKNLEKVPLQEKIENLKMEDSLLSEMIIAKEKEKFGGGFIRVLVFEGLVYIPPSDSVVYNYDALSPRGRGEIEDYSGMGLPGALSNQNNCLFLEVIPKEYGFSSYSAEERLIEDKFKYYKNAYRQAYFLTPDDTYSLYGGTTNYYEIFSKRLDPKDFQRNSYSGDFKHPGNFNRSGIFYIDSYYGPCKNGN